MPPRSRTLPRRSDLTPMMPRPISTAASRILSLAAMSLTRWLISKKASELNPKDDYAALWQNLAEYRDRVPGHLIEAARQLDMTAWPAPVVREFLGELNSAQTLAAAYDNDPKTRLGQTCEANFYGGEFALLKKNRQEALRLLRLAARDCPRSFVELTAAIAELIVQR